MDSTYLHVDDVPQLFVDSDIIEVTQGATRRWHKPQRCGDKPVLFADRPWERTLYFTYSNHVVLRDPADGLLKCWYEDLGELDGKTHAWKNRLLYAQSTDGVHWEKPQLDVAAVDGQPTNIVMGHVEGAEPSPANPWANVGVHSNGIVLDPHPPTPEERFRTIFSRATCEAGRGVRHEIQVAHSPDGIHWTPYEQKPTLGSSGSHLSDVSCLHYDPDARMFVQNTRHGRMGAAAHPPGTPHVCGWFAPYYPNRPDLMNKRRVYQTRSADFLHWTDPIPVSVPNDTDDNLDEGHYGMQQFRCGGMHFGTLGVFRFVDSEMDVRLLHSRDGLRFRPADRGRPFLAPRGAGHWDAHMVSMTSQPIELDGRWVFFHGGSSCHHDWWMAGGENIDSPEARDPQGTVRFCLGAAELRKEGLASLDAGPARPGYVLTRPLRSGGTRLAINARCRPGGEVRVALLDHHNQPLAPCTPDACDGFTGDATGHVLTWAGKADLPAAHQWRKVLVHLRNAEVFSIRFV